jgi:hypothetical protein
MNLDSSDFSADDKLRRIIVGLALESEIYNRRTNTELHSLYLNPGLEVLRELHDRLVASDDPRDREVALWLSLAVEKPPLKVDLQDLVKELEEIEFILLNLLRRVDEAAQIDINGWMNYIINTAHGVRDGFWMDAKIDMNLALQSSKSESVERIKADPHFTYEIGLLQKETSRRFKEIGDYPVTLDIPERRLNLILGIQGVLLDLMGRIYMEQVREEVELLDYVAQRLNAALRYVLRRDIQLEKAEKEIKLASSYLEEKAKGISQEDTAALAEETQKRIKALSAMVKS